MTHAQHKQEWTVTTEDGIPVVRDGKLTLAGFLLARIAEDAELANLAAVPVWRHQLAGGQDRIIDVDDTESDPVVAVFNGLDMDAMHVGRWFPARVLAECEAKRRIVELAEDASSLDLGVDLDRRVGTRDAAAEPYLGDLILRALALPYADRPGYREEWRP